VGFELETDAVDAELLGDYNRLKVIVTDAFVHWVTYRQLFGTSPERVELLNRSAGGFFHSVQSLFMNDICLRICRLTDPPE